jgi:hypothetical protein
MHALLACWVPCEQVSHQWAMTVLYLASAIMLLDTCGAPGGGGCSAAGGGIS